MRKQQGRAKVGFLNLLATSSISIWFVLKSEARSPRPSSAFTQTEQSQINASDYTPVPIPYPDLSKMDGAVQQQLQAAQSELISAIQRSGMTRVQLSEAYGQLGKLYEAYDLSEAAVACFLNAIGLEPQHFAWHYYLGYTYEQQANLNQAIVHYRNALDIQPDSLI